MHDRAVPHGLRPVLIAAACAAGVAGGAVALSHRGAAPVTFRRDVQPIFNRSCVSCHPSSFPYLDLRPGRAWAQLVRVTAETDPAFERVLPGRPELSYLLTHAPDPSNARLLSAADRRVIARWIRAGARDD